MYAWTAVIKKRETSLIIGFSFGSDLSCYGRLRYRKDKGRMELLRMPKQEITGRELKNFVTELQCALRDDVIPWQKTCMHYRSVEDEEEFGRMMDKVYA